MTIKYERDRFVAFAFAAADAFLELDNKGTIVFAEGAFDWLVGDDANRLVGCELEAYSNGRSGDILRAANTARTRGRFGPITLKFHGEKNTEKPVMVYGNCLPEYPDSVFLSLKSIPTVTPNLRSGESEQDDNTGLLDSDSFMEIATTLIKSIRKGDGDVALTLMELGDLKETVAKLDQQESDILLNQVAAQLNAASLDGSSAGQLAEEGFGILHDGSPVIADIEREINALENGGNLKGASATIILDDAGLSEVDQVKALVYSIDNFWDDPKKFEIGNLADGYDHFLADTKAKLAQFRTVLSKQQFDIVLQPIVGLASKKVHHYESLARIEATDMESLPQKFISVAEDLGVICDFDIAMCRKVIDRIKRADKIGKKLTLSVNVSSSSLTTERFVSEFLELLGGCRSIRDRLILEVTEATKIQDIDATRQVLSRIKGLGHAICLDDFGIGEDGYQYLRDLDVDFVKIDGVHVKEAFSNPGAREHLRSMVKFCSEVGVGTIGEMLETASEAIFLQDIGVDFGQGYFFGKPNMGVSERPASYEF